MEQPWPEKYPLPDALQPPETTGKQAYSAILSDAEILVSGARSEVITDGKHFFIIDTNVATYPTDDGPPDFVASVTHKIGSKTAFNLCINNEEPVVVEGRTAHQPTETIGQEHPSLDLFNKKRQAILNGQAVGAVRTAAIKCLGVGEEDDQRVIFVELAITHETAQLGKQPTTTADLHLVRNYNDGDSTIVQTTRLQSNPATGELLVGNTPSAEAWVDDPQASPDQIATAATHVFNPLPELSAQELADTQPTPTPVNRALTASEWSSLLTAPLSPEDLLR